MKRHGIQTGSRRSNPFVLFGIILLLVIPLVVAAQQGYYPGRTTGTDAEGMGYENPFEDPNAEETALPADSAKKKRPKRPLESYFFDDSTRAMPNFTWNVSLSRNRVEMQVIDTALNELQKDYPYLKQDVGDAILGPLGAGTIPLNYFRRPQYENFTFAGIFDTYLYTPENAPFFNVKKPFTHLNYYMSGQKKNYEEQFHILHAQNISPSTGFNISYKSRGTKGVYAWQGARAKNLSAGFSHTGKKYSLHAGYIYNAENVQEDGGVIDDSYVTDSIAEISQNVPMKMGPSSSGGKDGPRNILKNNTYYLVQSYGIPLRRLTDEDFSIADRSSIFFGYSIVYSRMFKNYTDVHAGTQYKDWSGGGTTPVTRDYYENWYIDPATTRDSIFESLLSNKVFIQIQPFDRDGIVGTIDAGIGMDNQKFYRFSPDQYITGNIDPVKQNNYYVYGSVEGKFKKYVGWGADMTYHPTGARSQDLDVGGELRLSIFFRKQPASLTGSFRLKRQTPDFWTQSYFSNHYVWSHSFAKENETRFDITLDVPQFGLELGGHQSLVSNRIYYDANVLPQQESAAVSVTGAYVRKDFHLGGFHLNNRVLLQWSTDQRVIPVPLAAVYLSWYFEFNVVKNVLRLQTGLDGRYNTTYYAFGYNPAIAKFYNQREKEIGGYPMIDVFVNAKWKRMRILLKLQHVDQNLFGKNYFDILHYPLNQRVFKLGFSWAFYD